MPFSPPRPLHCRRMKLPIQNEGAFTLTEVLISVFVLAIGLLGVISVFPVGIDAATRTLDRSAAALSVGTAVAELHRERETVFSTYAAATDEYSLYPGPAATTTQSIGVEKYRWNALVGEPPIAFDDDPGIGDMLLVQVAFFIRDPAGNEGSGATFLEGSRRVTFPGMPAGLVAGSYIRRTSTPQSRWYLIEELDPAGSAATLTSAFTRADGSGADGFLFTEDVFETILTSR